MQGMQQQILKYKYVLNVYIISAELLKLSKGLGTIITVYLARPVYGLYH